MIGAGFRNKTTTSHALCDLRLKMQQPGRRINLRKESACSRKRIEAGDPDLEGRCVQFRQRMHNGGKPVFGNLAKKDKRKVHLLRRSPSSLGEFYNAREVNKASGNFGWDRHANKETHARWMQQAA
jgi:hypothetical protein